MLKSIRGLITTITLSLVVTGSLLSITIPAVRADPPIQDKFNYLPLIMITSLKPQDKLFYLPKIVKYDPPVRLGPDGGPVYVLAIDPQVPSTLYGGSYGGMYKSVNSGQTWFPIRNGFPSVQYIQAIEVDPHNSNIVFASAYKDYLYRSSDGGAHWSPVYLDAGKTTSVIYGIEVDPHNSQQIFLALRLPPYSGTAPYHGYVYRSQDGGTTWSAVTSSVTIPNKGSLSWYYPFSVVVNPNVPGMVAAVYDITYVTDGPGLFISMDNGDSWVANTALASSNASPKGRDVLFLNTATLYYAAWGDGCGSIGKPFDLLRSPNAAVSWPLGSYCSLDIIKMAASQVPPIYTYVVAPGNTLFPGYGLLRTIDDEIHLALTNSGLPAANPTSVVVNPLDGNYVYAGGYVTTYAGGIIKDFNFLSEGAFQTSTGNSASPTWTTLKQGLSQTWSTSVLATPGDSNHLYLASYINGVFQSPDRGASWVEFNSGLGNLNVHNLVMNPAHDKLFAMTDTAGLYVRNISGGSWTAVTSPPAELPPASNPGAAYPPGHPFNPPEMLDSDTHPELYTTQAPAALPASTPLLSMLFSTQNPQVAYIATSGAGLYKSINGGTSWNAAGLGGQIVISFAIDPQNANVVYATSCQTTCPVDGNGNTVYTIKSTTNGGASWNTAFPNPPSTVLSVSMSTSNPSILYAGTSNGIYMYSSGTWTALGPAGVSVVSLAVHPSRSGYLYAGTTNGAYFSYNSGQTWFPGPIELNGLIVTNIQFDPNQPASVYYSTKFGSSLLVP
jgi:photosystem II stability/assembly factor-like uncharacterized protein